MATNSPNPPVISVRGSEGLYLLTPFQSDYSKLSKIDNFKDESKNCRSSTFDNTGRYFAYCNSVNINIVDVANNCIVLASINKPRTSYLKFSSQGNYLVAWETFYVAKEDQREIPNLNIYETATGQLVQSLIQKKQADRFVEWSHDDSVFAVLSGSEILFFESKNPAKIASKLRIENLSSFTMHPKSKILAVHGAGKKSEPSFIRLYQYPNLSAPLASKSFFNADKVEFKWNHHGNNLLLLCNTETSQNSYYGDSTLHQVNLKGESQIVQLSKKGPIYSVEWNPVKDEFIVVYGTMPAKATLFNSKCEAIYEFGTGPRNECFYNPHGNIVCLAGFGNLRGRIEVWNVSSSNKVPQEITTIQVDDVTFFQWSPDGEHILTATTAPRLRVSNGFKVWNYLGENKFTHMVPANNNELWQVQWQPGVYPVKLVAKNATPVAKEETKAYVPPHLRGANRTSNIKSKLHDDDEKPDNKLKAKSTEKSEAEIIEKKIKTVKKKLAQIDELKERQAKGETLEKNQLDKLKSEAELLLELKKLNISN